MSVRDAGSDLRRRVAALDSAQRAALAARLGMPAAPASVRAASSTRLVAYVVIGTDREPPDPGELREFLRARLPEALVPSAFVALERLPRLPNGKVDVAALPEPDVAGEARAPAVVAPRTAIERALADVWAEVLGTSRIGVTDNFFELGGDSLLSIQVIAKARAAGIALTPEQLFRHQTLAELAASARLHAEGEPGSAPPPGPDTATAAGPALPPGVEAIDPLTPTQSSLLFASLHAAGERDPAFLHLRCTLDGDLDEEAFEESWRRVVARHTALRSSVMWERLERPVQVVHERVELSWVVADWRERHPSELEALFDDFLTRDRARGLDLTRAPVLRLARFRTGDREWRLVCSCHHVLLDGWSGELILREVLAAHDALRRGDAAPLAPARPFREYAAWLQRQDLSGAEEFFRHELAGLREPTPLPFDRARSAGATGSESLEEQAVRLDDAAWAALHDFARRERLTAGTVLQGAWALLLSEAADAAEVCFGATVSGRTVPFPDIDAIAGLFTSALPIRVPVPREAPLADFLRQLQSRTAELRAYEHIAPAQIQAWSGVAGSRRVFDSLVVIQRSPADAGLADTSLSLRVRELSGGMTTSYPLTLVATTGECLALRLVHDTARFDGAEARRILDAVGTLLSRMPGHAGTAVAALLSDPLIRLPAGSAAQPVAATPPSPRGRASAELPRDTLQLQLAQLWESVLDVHPIGVHDDFFALGGHSLSAAQLFEQIERVFRRRLPLATLFEAPTVERLAARLIDDGWTPPWSSLVAMQPEGSGSPLFCVHSYEGNVLVYRLLARHLAPELPVYGLQSVGLDGSSKPLATVEEMAAHYIDEIRSVRPHGPYTLVGICFGISVAFEMAQRLHAAGERVEKLIILDSGFLTMVPRRRVELPDPVMRIVQRTQAHARQLGRRARRFLEQRRSTEAERRERVLRDANVRAFFAYTPRPYAGRIALIRTAEYGVKQEWHDQTWSALAGDGLETYIVPGGHRQLLLEPNVRHVAGRIREALGVATRAG